MSDTPPKLPPSREMQSGDATGGVIPYKNPTALTSYYLGVFSIIPFIGFVLGLVALPLGIVGLRARKKNPLVRGAAHAWTGIIVGSLSIAAHIGFVLLMVA